MRTPRLQWFSLAWAATLAALLAVPSEAAGAEATGILSVTANVEGAVVHVDGEELGEVPLTQYLPVGSHQVRITADHHDPFVRRVEVAADTTTRLEATLRPGAGTVEFMSDTRGATVFLDGEEVGPTPIRLQDVSPGTHSWRVEADGYEPQEEEFTFRRGQNLLFNVELPSLDGVFEVLSSPAGATVSLNGEEVGTTPLVLRDVPLAAHRVTVSLKGHGTILRKVDTTGGGKGEVDARLSRGGTTLVVRTGSPDAEVSFAGHPLGSGRKVTVGPLHRTSGTLEVRLGEEVLQRRISLSGSGRVLVRAQPKDRGDAGHALVELPPLHQRWTFWAAAGGVAAAGTGLGLLAAGARVDPPEGDVVVELP